MKRLILLLILFLILCSVSKGVVVTSWDPYAVHWDTFTSDTYTITDSNITLTNGTLTAANITDSGLTITRVPYASTAGLLIDSANLTFDGTELYAGNVLCGSIEAVGLLKVQDDSTGQFLEIKAWANSISYPDDRRLTINVGNADRILTFTGAGAAGDPVLGNWFDQDVRTTATPGFASGVTIGTLTLADGSITDSSGDITFSDVNLVTTGTFTANALKDYFKANKIKSGAVFQSQSNNSLNKRLTTRGLRLIVKEILNELGIEKSTHGFRHYFTTTLIKTYKGDLLEVAGYTRHKSLEMLQVYFDKIKKDADLPRYYRAFNGVSF